MQVKLILFFLVTSIGFSQDTEWTYLFDGKTFDLLGWQNTDIYQNFNITFLSSIRKNRVLSKNLFKIPIQN